MPRVSRGQAALNRQHIVEVAASLYREHGINGIGLADLMAEAGVTHGGFYGHFASKEALAAEACSLAFQKSGDSWEEIIGRHAESKGEAFQAIARKYLYKPENSGLKDICPLPTLATDSMRQPEDSPLRQAFTAGMRRLGETLVSLMPDSYSKKIRRERGLASLALLVGTMTLARAGADEALTKELLAAADKTLSELAA